MHPFDEPADGEATAAPGDVDHLDPGVPVDEDLVVLEVGQVVRHTYVDAMTNREATDTGVVVLVDHDTERVTVAKLDQLVTVAADVLEVVV